MSAGSRMPDLTTNDCFDSVNEPDLVIAVVFFTMRYTLLERSLTETRSAGTDVVTSSGSLVGHADSEFPPGRDRSNEVPGQARFEIYGKAPSIQLGVDPRGGGISPVHDIVHANESTDKQPGPVYPKSVYADRRIEHDVGRDIIHVPVISVVPTDPLYANAHIRPLKPRGAYFTPAE